MRNIDTTGSDALGWQELLKEFAPIPTLVRKIAPGDRAYETTQMLQGPAYLLMEQMIADSTIVYSPPKVGGQTIAATLWAHPTIPQPKHIHFLSPKGLAFMERLIEQSRSHPNQHMWQTLMLHSRWVRVLLAANRMLRAGGLSSIVPKPILIAGVREPMGQYLSMVFQAWWMYADTPAALNAESIRAQMINDPWRQQCNNWFKDDLEATTGLDVFAKPFPTEQGWDIYENDVARVLIIRQENLNSLPQALGALYGIDPATIQLENRNRAEEKEYATEYAAVKKAWRPSEKDLEEVYSPPYVHHFYTLQEVKAFQERWRNRAGKASEQSSSESKKQPSSPVPEKSAAKSATGQACGHTSFGASQPAHHWACRPCPQCAQEIQSIPILQKTCAERQEIIERMRSLWPMRVLLKFRQLYRRIFRGNRITR